VGLKRNNLEKSAKEFHHNAIASIDTSGIQTKKSDIPGRLLAVFEVGVEAGLVEVPEELDTMTDDEGKREVVNFKVDEEDGEDGALVDKITVGSGGRDVCNVPTVIVERGASEREPPEG